MILNLIESGYLNDLFCFDPNLATWTDLFPSGPAPSIRASMGFVAAPDGKLYVFGGEGPANTENAGKFRMTLRWGWGNCVALCKHSTGPNASCLKFLKLC